VLSELSASCVLAVNGAPKGSSAFLSSRLPVNSHFQGRPKEVRIEGPSPSSSRYAGYRNLLQQSPATIGLERHALDSRPWKNRDHLCRRAGGGDRQDKRAWIRPPRFSPGVPDPPPFWRKNGGMREKAASLTSVRCAALRLGAFASNIRATQRWNASARNRLKA